MRRRPSIAVLLGLTIVLAGCGRLGGEAFQPTQNGDVAIGADARAGQTFRSPSGSVARVDLLMATYGEAADPDGTLGVTLGDPGSAVPRATATVPGTQLVDNDWVRVAFDPPAEVGETVVMDVTWDGAAPVGLRVNAPSVAAEEALASGDLPGGDAEPLVNDAYPHGQLTRDGVPVDGDLSFRVQAVTGPAEVTATITGLARGLVGRLQASPAFTVGWLVLVVASASLAVSGWRGARRARRGELAPAPAPGARGRPAGR